MLLIKAGNPADARARNDKEEARRTHQERGRMEVGVGGRGREGREVEMWRLRALVGGSGFVGQSHVQASETVHPQPYREKKDTTRVGIHESSLLTCHE